MKWKSLPMPKRIEFEESTFTNTYGKFFIQPLDRGFGLTLGTALRRVLLSSIQGAAITAAKIDGVLHEFSTIEGMLEDVTEIIMNLKTVRLKLHGEEPKTLYLKKNGKGIVTAGDIEPDSDIEILNPNQYIAALSENGKLSMELIVTTGRGYVPAEKLKNSEYPIGTILIDAIYSPINRVIFHIENKRVGQRTDFDKLILEILTDGSIKPDDALAFAAKILKDHLQLLINFQEEPEIEEEEEEDEEFHRIAELLNRSVDELELSVRSQNCLKSANIKTLGDLVQKTEAQMLKYRNFGRKSLSELGSILNELGLHFGIDVGYYLPDKYPLKEEAVIEEK